MLWILCSIQVWSKSAPKKKGITTPKKGGRKGKDGGITLPSCFHTGFLFSSGALGTDIDTTGSWTFDTETTQTLLQYDFNNHGIRHSFFFDYFKSSSRLFYSMSKTRDFPVQSFPSTSSGLGRGRLEIRENEIQANSFPAQQRNYTCIRCTVYTLPKSWKFPQASTFFQGFQPTVNGFDARKLRSPVSPLASSSEPTLSLRTRTFQGTKGSEPLSVVSYLDNDQPSGELLHWTFGGSSWDFHKFVNLVELPGQDRDTNAHLSSLNPPDCPCAFGDELPPYISSIVQKYIPYPLH